MVKQSLFSTDLQEHISDWYNTQQQDGYLKAKVFGFAT